MTDFKEDQKNEIEALESIYPEELNVLETEPYHVFTVRVSSQDTDSEEESDSAICTIKFTYTENYPEEAPSYEIDESECLDDKDISQIMNLINEQIEENLGMVMVFTIYTAVQEKLTDLVLERQKRKKEEEERKIQELEAEEQRKFEGTKVTIETFLAWKTKFDAEMVEVKKIEAQQNTVSKKLTGKEMFLQDNSMIDSDVKFLESEDNSVEVDESLFQDMDDLDIDDENLEDLIEVTSDSRPRPDNSRNYCGLKKGFLLGKPKEEEGTNWQVRTECPRKYPRKKS